jgi:hypothetical protein
MAALAAAGNDRVEQVLKAHGCEFILGGAFKRLVDDEAADVGTLAAAWGSGMTPLQAACLFGDSAAVQRELDSCGDGWAVMCACAIGAADGTGSYAPVSPLTLAVLAHNELAVDVLLQHPPVIANIDWLDCRRWAAFHYAALGDGPAAAGIICRLAAAGANVNLQAGFCGKVHALKVWVHTTADRPSVDVGRALLAMGVDTRERNEAATALQKDPPSILKLCAVLEGATYADLNAKSLGVSKIPGLRQCMAKYITYSRRMHAVSSWHIAHEQYLPVAPQDPLLPLSLSRPLHASWGLLGMPLHPLDSSFDIHQLSASMPSDYKSCGFAHYDNGGIPVLFGIPRSSAQLPEGSNPVPVWDTMRCLHGMSPAGICWLYHNVYNRCPCCTKCTGSCLDTGDLVTVARRIIHMVTSVPGMEPTAAEAVKQLFAILRNSSHTLQQLVPELLGLLDHMPVIAAAFKTVSQRYKRTHCVTLCESLPLAARRYVTLPLPNWRRRSLHPMQQRPMGPSSYCILVF